MTFTTRRIFKSAITSQNVIRELLQLMFLGELVSPSGKRIWIVSPWISNVTLLDNRAAGFSAVNPEWGAREIRLVDIVLRLLALGCPVGLVTSLDEHNDPLLETLSEAAREAGFDSALDIVRRQHLHTKGILTGRGLLTGSMNLTYRGLELNDEMVVYDTAPKTLAEARLNFEPYLVVP